MQFNSDYYLEILEGETTNYETPIRKMISSDIPPIKLVEQNNPKKNDEGTRYYKNNTISWLISQQNKWYIITQKEKGYINYGSWPIFFSWTTRKLNPTTLDPEYKSDFYTIMHEEIEIETEWDAKFYIEEKKIYSDTPPTELFNHKKNFKRECPNGINVFEQRGIIITQNGLPVLIIETKTGRDDEFGEVITYSQDFIKLPRTIWQYKKTANIEKITIG